MCLTCVVFYNVPAKSVEPLLKTFNELINCVLTCVVFYNVSATSDEPPPKTFDEFTKRMFDMCCIRYYKVL